MQRFAAARLLGGAGGDRPVHPGASEWGQAETDPGRAGARPSASVRECPRCHGTRTPTNCCARLEAIEDGASRIVRSLGAGKPLLPDAELPQDLAFLAHVIETRGARMRDATHLLRQVFFDRDGIGGKVEDQIARLNPALHREVIGFFGEGGV